ncbi:diguanylate cyclase [Plantactinospora sp. KBS50]|uniref:GGDEF domain-containing protein n=1 Tax=Plantactinospora sp. KBS50 TaxID=2024580 RepID=UPI000BAB01FF|nr:diguanylate cyclase [Plantactinospora sp. KBS50]ASW53408.1 diguanylate cyclase [Plantactinospora sp. KBS50]
MTLRRRLTTALLTVVLGPVLLGAVFAGGTLATVDVRRVTERLDLAATVARTSIGSLCLQLRAAADAIALTAEPAGRVATANQVVGRGLAAAVRLAGPTGAVDFQTPGAPAQPWVDCGTPSAPVPQAYAIAVHSELRDRAGTPMGVVWAAAPLDEAFVARLAAVTGVEVALGYGDTATAAGPGTGTAVGPGSATAAGPGAAAPATGSRFGRLTSTGHSVGDALDRTGDGRYVRRVGPSPGQPLPLVLMVRSDPPVGTYLLLVAAVLLAGGIAVVAARRLARSTTRPLAELAVGAQRVAQGDLSARVPVHGPDEVGRVAEVVNRMARETQEYLQALNASRDQLRGNLTVLGDTLASTHDLDRILRVILRSAITASGARSGLVLLVDELTGTLVGQCAEGLPTPAVRPGGPAYDPSRIRVPLGRGLLGRVAATGEPRRGRVRRDVPVLTPEEPRCSTYVAVPFAAPGSATDGPVSTAAARAAITLGGTAPPAALGVLALYDRLGSDDFDDADLATLRSFARHAAVAVDNVRVHEEAQRLSLTDPLTGLWNYRYLKESIRREVERASRFGRMLSVLALDLDRFKDVNDTYGHAAGDAVLVEFARRIRAVVREVDLAFRQGGEEFVVLLPETDARGAIRVAERLGAAIRSNPVIAPTGAQGAPPALITISVSIGIAVYPDHATTGQRVLDAADDALYAAKAAGRDTYRIALPGTRPLVTGRVAPVEPGLPAADPPRAGAAAGGASSGPQPPRQGRGR